MIPKGVGFGDEVVTGNTESSLDIYLQIVFTVGAYWSFIAPFMLHYSLSVTSMMICCRCSCKMWPNQESLVNRKLSETNSSVSPRVYGFRQPKCCLTSSLNTSVNRKQQHNCSN